MGNWYRILTPFILNPFPNLIQQKRKFYNYLLHLAGAFFTRYLNLEKIQMSYFETRALSSFSWPIYWYGPDNPISLGWFHWNYFTGWWKFTDKSCFLWTRISMRLRNTSVCDCFLQNRLSKKWLTFEVIRNEIDKLKALFFLLDSWAKLVNFRISCAAATFSFELEWDILQICFALGLTKFSEWLEGTSSSYKTSTKIDFSYNSHPPSLVLQMRFFKIPYFISSQKAHSQFNQMCSSQKLLDCIDSKGCNLLVYTGCFMSIVKPCKVL